MTIRRMMAWGASVPSSPALSRTALRLRGLTARPAQAGRAFMCNARACDAPGKISIRHCPKGHIPTFTNYGRGFTAVQHCGTTLGHNTGAQHWDTNTGAQHWGTTLGHNTGAQHWGTTLGHNTVRRGPWFAVRCYGGQALVIFRFGGHSGRSSFFWS